MKRGEIYLVATPGRGDPRRNRPYVVVARQKAVDSRFSTAVCAPVYSLHDNIRSQVLIGPEHGLKHPSSVHCDNLVSLPKRALTNFVGQLSAAKMAELDYALAVAVGIDHLLA